MKGGDGSETVKQCDTDLKRTFSEDGCALRLEVIGELQGEAVIHFAIDSVLPSINEVPNS